MDVVFLSPDYPTDLPLFVSGLAEVGARVTGVGDQHVDSLTDRTEHALADYVQVGSWSDEDAAFESILRHLHGRNVDRIETLWEPLVMLAARLRERIGVPGMSVADALAFRDKGVMKERVEAAGIRTPRSARSTTRAGCRDAAEAIGFPIIIKPIAGAGSADTHRIDDEADLERTLEHLDHVPEVSVEEFIIGDEFTYDTVCANREIVFENVCEYRPNPLIGKQVEWISPQVIAYRDLADPFIADGVDLGRRVIAAMGFDSGFTHMEWYRMASGEVVFGEIGAAIARGSADRRDELRVRHRPVPRVGRGGVPRHLRPAQRASVQRGGDLQTGAGRGDRDPGRGCRRDDGPHGRARRERRPRAAGPAPP